MSRPYYESEGGLRFECTRCGACCTRPGPVYFPASDLARAAAHLDLAPAEFRRKFNLRKLNGVLALDPPGDGPCRFLEEDGGCGIYEGRPEQCRTWPFWPETVGRERSWRRAARDCEGIDRGPRHEPQLIRSMLDTLESIGVPEGDAW